MNRLQTLGNSLLYHWRRSKWLLDPHRFFRSYEEVPIRSPIFLLGNQGGGLTLIGRMLRRSPTVVSITGNHRYWTGPDEMQRVMELRLPKSLKLARLPFRVEVEHERLTAPRSWSYATDELIGAYRRTEEDYSPEEAAVFLFLIREALYKYARGRDARFLDKSQVYTVKLRLLKAILAETDPCFVLVTRNPFVACFRAAQGKAIDMARYAREIDLAERIELCAQHWRNAMRCALEDGESTSRFRMIRFEDVLADPRKEMEALCDFLDLPFDDDMLPQRHHVIPQGSRFPDRWYPLKADVNRSYLKEIPPFALDIIEARCGDLAGELGYARPEVAANG